MDDRTLQDTTRRLIAEYGDLLPATFIASTVEAAAAPQGADGPGAAEIARADVDAAAQAALRAQASPDAVRTGHRV